MASTLNADNGSISGSSGLKSSADASGVLQLQTNGTTSLTVDTSQNVGIGTTSPGQKLTVSGLNTVANFISSSTGVYLKFNNSTAGDSYIGSIGGANLYFDTGGTERMRIASNGNLLVGTTSSSTPVSGFTAEVSAGGSGVYTRINIGHSSSAGTGEAFSRFLFNSSVIGSITRNSASTVAYNTSSDYRLKENITPMQNALGVVAQLKPVTYTWKANGSDGQGFIAHELQEVVPDCVTGEKDAVDDEGKPIYQGIDTSFLVATLTAAIQELKAEIDSLKAQISG